MKTTKAELELQSGVDELFAVLDRDIDHLEKNLSRLDQLRSFVVKQDQDSLGRLLDNIRVESKLQQHNDTQRQTIRKDLAFSLNCSVEDVTLTRIAAYLSGEKKSELLQRKKRLNALAGLLKKEYLGTQLLLSDCQRFNRTLLKRIFEKGQSNNITYKSTGHSERQTDTVFMNLKF